MVIRAKPNHKKPDEIREEIPRPVVEPVHDLLQVPSGNDISRYPDSFTRCAWHSSRNHDAVDMVFGAPVHTRLE